MASGKLPDRKYLSLYEAVTFVAFGEALTSEEDFTRPNADPENVEICDLIDACIAEVAAEPDRYTKFIKTYSTSRTELARKLEACRPYWPPSAKSLYEQAKRKGKLDDEHLRKFNEAETLINAAAYAEHILLRGKKDGGSGKMEPIHATEFGPTPLGERITFISTYDRVGPWRNVHVEREGLEKLFGKQLPQGGKVDASTSKKRRGRPPGAGSYGELDLLLVEKGIKMVETGKVASPQEAARQLSGDAYGAGTLESKTDRIARRIRTQMEHSEHPQSEIKS